VGVAISFISGGHRVIKRVTAGRPIGAASAHSGWSRPGGPPRFVDSAPEPFVDDERERVNESLSRWWVLLMVAVLLLLLAFVVHVSK
jgi:hypothetical protein